jgi:hypothetical protein
MLTTSMTWEECRTAYAASELTWRKSVADRVADWALGCGWCSLQRDQHQDEDLRLVLGAPVDYATADRTLGRVFPLSAFTDDSVTALHDAWAIALALLTPDAEGLPR